MPLALPHLDEAPTISEDLLQSDSVIDLLQASQDINMFYMPDDVPFMIPQSESEIFTPPATTMDVKEIVRQDALIGSYFQNSLANTVADVTYVSQYEAPSALLNTTVSEAFVAPIPVSINTQHVFAKPALPTRTAKPAPRQSPRTAHQLLINPFVPNQRQMLKNPFAQMSRGQSAKARNTSTKAANRHSFIRASLNSHVRPPARISLVKSSRSSENRTKSQSILLINASQSAFAPASNRTSSIKSTAVTHSVTHTVTFVTESPMALASEMVTVTTTTVAKTISQRAAIDSLRTLKTTTVASYATRTRPLVNPGDQGMYGKLLHSGSFTTSTVTSYTMTKSHAPSTTIPMQSAFDIPATVLYPSPMIIPSLSPTGPCTRAAAASMKPITAPTTSDSGDDEFPVFHTQTTHAVATTYTSPTTTSGAMMRPRTRLIIPVTLSPYATSAGLSIVTTAALVSNTITKPRVGLTTRHTHNAFAATNIQTHSSAAIAATTSAIARGSYTVVPTQSTCPIPAGATLYAAKTVPSPRAVRKRTLPVTTACQTFTLDDGKGTYTTLTITSDLAGTARSTATTTTQSAVTSGSSSHGTSSIIASDSTVRSRNQLLIPIASTTTTGLSYLVTSSINSLAAVTRTAFTAAAASSQASMIRSDISNRIRSRLIIPLAHNISSACAAVGLTSTVADSNKIPSPRDLLPVAETALSAIRPFGITTTHNSNAITTTPYASHTNISERVTRSRSAAAIIADQGVAAAAAASNDRSSIAALLASDFTSRNSFAVNTPSVNVQEPTTRPLGRMVIPFIHGIPNQSSASAGAVASNLTTNSGVNPTSGAYIITTGVGSSSPSPNPAGVSPKPAHRVVIPILHSSSAPIVSTSTTTTANSFTHTSPKNYADAISNIRNRLQLPIVSTTANCESTDNFTVTTSSMTTFTVTRSHAPSCITQAHSVLDKPVDHSPSSITTTHNVYATTATFISFATSTVAPSAAARSRSPFAASATPSDIPASTLCVLTTAAPILTTTGHRYVIKLATTQSAGVANVSTVTAAVTTPLTTAALSPPEHRFLEPQPVSRLRTFPSPRTYSVAQRNVLRSSARNITRQSVTKRIVSSPAPLQIFADVVCPQTITPNQTTSTVTQAQPGPRFSLSEGSGSSALKASEYKSTVFKHLSSIGTTRHSSTPTERLVLKRSVACVSPRRSVIGAQTVPYRTPTTCTVTQRVRFTYGDVRPQAGRVDAAQRTPVASADPMIAQPAPQSIANTLPYTASDSAPSERDEEYNSIK